MLFRIRMLDMALYLGTILWCGYIAFPLSASVRNTPGRVTLYLVLFLGLTLLNTAAGLLVGCCLSIAKGMT